MCNVNVRGDPARLYYASSGGLRSRHFLGFEFSRTSTDPACSQPIFASDIPDEIPLRGICGRWSHVGSFPKGMANISR